MNVRKIAYNVLEESEKKSKYISLALDSAISRGELSGEDRALLSALVYGVTERKTTLDYFISALSGRNIRSLDSEVLNLLRLGAYQIIYMDKIPDSAAVNETVKLASRYAARSKNFVNAILRRICREKSSLPYPTDNTERLSIENSIPKELCEHFMRDYPDDFEEIIRASNSKPKLTLTVNTLRSSRDSLAKIIGDGCEKTAFSEKGLKLTSSFAVSDFSPLSDGLCYVQDEASQIAVSALAPKSGDTVIDVCSCPGGKSFFSAILMENVGKIYCFDLHESKLPLIKNQAEKLGIEIINAERHDSRVAKEDLIEKADKVICDVPCSGLGVLAKKPEIRHKSFNDLSELDNIQKEILEASAKYVKVGGVLLYSTCTLRKAENEERVAQFLSTHPNFELLPFSVGTLEAKEGLLTLLPSKHSTDGFFISLLKRRS